MKCLGELVVSEISTKTGVKKYAATKDNVTASLCNQYGNCCSTLLDDPDVVDRQLGRLDTYTGSNLLGDCFGFKTTGGEISAALEISEKDIGADGWFVEWLKIKFSVGKEYICKFNGFIKNRDDRSPKKRTVPCKEQGERLLIL